MFRSECESGIETLIGRISWLGPAAMGLKGDPLRGSECQAPGVIFASALWWLVLLKFAAD